ncbi:hypothetical protein Tco_0335081 [Tanacetum coccineum]
MAVQWRSTVVNHRSTVVNHRSTAAVNGSDWRSTTVNSGGPPLTIVGPLPDHQSTTTVPKKSLILSSEKVNADDGADNSLSGTTMQPVTQPKAPTDLNLKKKKISPSSKPKSSYKVRDTLPKKQAAETQLAEEPVATSDATQSLDASESAEAQEEVKECGLESMGGVTFKQIIDEIDQQNQTTQEKPKSPYDTESDIKIIKRFQPSQPDNDAQITFWVPNHIIKQSQGMEGTSETFYAFADMPAQSNPLGHLHEELRILNTKIDQLESNITKKLTDHIQSSMSSIVADSLKEICLELSKVIKTKLGVSVKNKVRKGMKVVSDKLASLQSTMATNSQHVQDLRKEKSSEINTLEKKVTYDEPPVKKLKFLIPASSIPSPTLLNLIMPKPLQKPDAMTIDQFTEYLTKTTLSIFSPTPPR